MKNQSSKVYPEYVPYYYRWCLKARKVYRQSMVRFYEGKARKRGAVDVVEDGEAKWPQIPLEQQDAQSPLNRAAAWIDDDMQKEHVKKISDEIKELKATLDQKGLRYCSPAGTFINETYISRTERTKNWENCWVLANSNIQPGARVLDIGGASTIFSFYLASKGCSVEVVDNDWGNCGILYNANYVADKMGWDLKAHDRNISEKFSYDDESFDRVFSICVVEHLPSSLRKHMMKEVSRILKPGGIVGISTDYDHGREVLVSDKGLRFAYADKLFQEIITPSGLNLMGNQDLYDAIDPKINFLGAFFLNK